MLAVSCRFLHAETGKNTQKIPSHQVLLQNWILGCHGKLYFLLYPTIGELLLIMKSYCKRFLRVLVSKREAKDDTRIKNVRKMAEWGGGGHLRSNVRKPVELG